MMILFYVVLTGLTDWYLVLEGLVCKTQMDSHMPSALVEMAGMEWTQLGPSTGVPT